MTHTISLLFANSFPIYALGISGVLGLTAGFLLRVAINAKQKKNILQLENEMLSNHSRILDLEKQVSILEKDNYELSAKPTLKKAELRAS